MPGGRRVGIDCFQVEIQRKTVLCISFFILWIKFAF